VTELEYLLKHGGLTPKRLLQKITRRGFGVSVLGGLIAAAASRLMSTPSPAVAGTDFTIAIIPDPQFLAESCPDGGGRYYTAMMQWIVDNKNIIFTSSPPSFDANIKAVVGVGDCVTPPLMLSSETQRPAGRFLTRIASPSLRLRGTTTTQATPLPGVASERNSKRAISLRSTALQFTVQELILVTETWLTGLDLMTLPEPTQR
jgi:hypothetical protein